MVEYALRSVYTLDFELVPSYILHLDRRRTTCSSYRVALIRVVCVCVLYRNRIIIVIFLLIGD